MPPTFWERQVLPCVCILHTMDLQMVNTRTHSHPPIIIHRCVVAPLRRHTSRNCSPPALLHTHQVPFPSLQSKLACVVSIPDHSPAQPGYVLSGQLMGHHRDSPAEQAFLFHQPQVLGRETKFGWWWIHYPVSSDPFPQKGTLSVL